MIKRLFALLLAALLLLSLVACKGKTESEAPAAKNDKTAADGEASPSEAALSRKQLYFYEVRNGACSASIYMRFIPI